jgi:hypothetical protein
MRRFIAKITQKIEIDRVVYKKGDTIILEESAEYAPAMWIVRDDVTSTDLLSNEYGVVFEVVEEVAKAA